MAEQKRRFGCLSILALLFLIGVSINAINSNFGSQPTETQERIQDDEVALPDITFEGAIREYENINLKDFALANCTLFDDLDFEDANSVVEIISKLKKIDTSREAAEFLADNKVPASDYGTFWSAGFNDQINQLAFSVAQKVDRTKYSIEGSWGPILKDSLIENCEKGTAFSKMEEDFLTLKFEVNRVRTLYANMPWYPDGYQLFSTDIAYKFNKSRGCDYFDCWNIDVVTKYSCSSLYVEMNIYDRSDSIVGFTNDSARNVRAGEIVKLRLDDIYDGSSGRITEMRCL
jgi:hypothetical protein